MESGMERGKSGKEEDGRGSTLLWGVYRISFLLRLLGRILPIVPFNIARFRWFLSSCLGDNIPLFSLVSNRS